MSLTDDLAAVIADEFRRHKIDRVCDEGHEERFATIAVQAIAERLEQVGCWDSYGGSVHGDDEFADLPDWEPVYRLRLEENP